MHAKRVLRPVNLSCWRHGPGRAGTRRRPSLNLPQAVRRTSEAWLEGKVPSLVASSLPTAIRCPRTERAHITPLRPRRTRARTAHKALIRNSSPLRGVRLGRRRGRPRRTAAGWSVRDAFIAYPVNRGTGGGIMRRICNAARVRILSATLQKLLSGEGGRAGQDVMSQGPR